MNAFYPFARCTTDATLIRSSGDMAQLLRASCPDQASGYALAAHERACSGHDDDRVSFWAEVVRLLSSRCIGMALAS